MDWWFGIKSALGRGVVGGLAGTLGTGVALFLNHAPVWYAPLSGVAAGLIIYVITKTVPTATGR